MDRFIAVIHRSRGPAGAVALLVGVLLLLQPPPAMVGTGAPWGTPATRGAAAAQEMGAIESAAPRGTHMPVRAAAYADGTLVRGSASSAIYAIYGGVAHVIASPTVLNLLGFGAAHVLVLPQATVNALPKGGTFDERIIANGLPDPYSPVHTVRGNLFLYPPSAAAGASVTVKGTGFTPGEAVRLSLASGALVLQAPADAAGDVQAVFIVPSALALGVYRLTGVGLKSGFFAIEPFTVIPATAHPTVTPNAAFTVPSGAFTVGGTGFQPGEILYLYTAQAYATTSAANAGGTFGPVTLVMPTAAAVGHHSIWVYGTSSRYVAAGTIAVAGPGPASIQATPASVAVGSVETVSGAGFVPGEQVALAVDNQPAGQVVAGEAGTFAQAITVPPHVHGGAVALSARGLTSGRAASAVISIIILTPHLLISPLSAAPGATLTIAGTGFSPGEPVAISFDGAPLPTTPPAIAADAQGNFFASAVVPDTALSGANAVAATGARSLAVAGVTVTVRRPVLSAWYFAGVDTRPGAWGFIAVLNPDNNPARLALHVAFADAPARDLAVTVAAHSRGTVDLATLTGRRALCFVTVRADRRIAAAAMTWRGTRDWSFVRAAAAPARTWYLPEGYTGGSYHESLRLYNPGSAPAAVTVQLLPGRGRTRTLRLTVGGDSGTEIDVNRHLARQSVAAIVTAGAPIVAARAITFGPHGFGASEATGSTGASATWLFAEGSTLNGTQALYTVLNPNRRDPAAVTATFYDARGVPSGTRTVIVGPQRRGGLTANGAVRSAAMATVLSSNVPVVAERTLYFGQRRGHGVAGSAVPGFTGGALSWEFPEGDTGTGYLEYLLLFNPSAQPAAVGIEFYTAAGTATHLDVSVAPHARYTLPVNTVPGLPPGQHGALLTSSNGVPFIAEQSIYGSGFTRGDSIAGLAG